MALKFMYESLPINIPLTIVDDSVTSGTKTWSSAKIVQNSNAVAQQIGTDFGYNYKFTYLVDDDNSLEYWLTNRGSGVAIDDADFTNVLIRGGTYTYSGDSVDLDTIGTKSIVGEAGAHLVLNGNAKLNYLKIHREPAYFMQGFEVTSDTTKDVIVNAFDVRNVIVNQGFALAFADRPYMTNTGRYWFQDDGSILTSLYDCIYAAGLYAALATDGIYTSADGKTWTKCSSYTDGKAKSITYCNGRYILYIEDITVSEDDDSTVTNSSTVVYTTDFSEFTEIGAGETGSELSVIAGNLFSFSNRLFSCGQGSLFIASEDLSVWNNTNINAKPTAMAQFNGLYVCGTAEDSASNGLYYSADGFTWSTEASVTDDIKCLSVSGSKCLALTSDNKIWYSNDGETWNISSVSTSSEVESYTNPTRINNFFTKGSTTFASVGPSLYKSTDGGAVWSLIDGVTLEHNVSVNYLMGDWVVGKYWSTDGETWKENENGIEFCNFVFASNVALTIKGCCSVRDSWLNARDTDANYSSPVVSSSYTLGSDIFGGLNVFPDDKEHTSSILSDLFTQMFATKFNEVFTLDEESASLTISNVV